MRKPISEEPTSKEPTFEKPMDLFKNSLRKR